jgi:hypothetical protein
MNRAYVQQCFSPQSGANYADGRSKETTVLEMSYAVSRGNSQGFCKPFPQARHTPSDCRRVKSTRSCRSHGTISRTLTHKRDLQVLHLYVAAAMMTESRTPAHMIYHCGKGYICLLAIELILYKVRNAQLKPDLQCSIHPLRNSSRTRL